MKNIILFQLLLLIVGIGLSVSCDQKFDDLKPHNAITQNYLLSTKEGIKQVTSANYSNFHNYLGSSAGGQTYNATGLFGRNQTDALLFLNESIGNNFNVSDLDVSYGSSVFYYQTGINNNDIANILWQGGYATIGSCNNVLDAIEKQPAKATDADLIQYKGDNLFIRAYIYYNLAQVFCRPYYDNPTVNMGLPLKLTPDATVIAERGTIKALYEQVVADLTAAAALLPDNPAPNRNLVNRYACYGLLSRVYRDMGGSFSQPDNANNQLAVDNATKILGGTWGGYIPGSDKTDAYIKGIYGIAPSKNNKEYLLCVDPTLMSNNGYQTVNTAFQPDEMDIFADGLSFSLSPDLLNLFDKTNDRRYKYFIIPDPFASFHEPPWDKNSTCGKFVTGKFGTSIFGDPTPLPFIRIAEIYLNRAEAYVKSGKSAEALSDLNYVKERAGLAPLTGLSGQSLFNEILNERRRELFCESLTGRDNYRNALPMTRNYASGFPEKDVQKIEANDYRVIFPIPIFEQNVTGVLQNPGY